MTHGGIYASRYFQCYCLPLKIFKSRAWIDTGWLCFNSSLIGRKIPILKRSKKRSFKPLMMVLWLFLASSRLQELDGYIYQKHLPYPIQWTFVSQEKVKSKGNLTSDFSFLMILLFACVLGVPVFRDCS